MATGSRYAAAEVRYARWLEEYRLDRAAHAKARNAHPDPAGLDADFARACGSTIKGIVGLHESELRSVTDLLLQGARADTRHFEDYELSRENLGDVVDLLEQRNIDSALASFLEALTASGSLAVLSNRRYCGNGGQELPYFVLRAVVAGEPWGCWHRSETNNVGLREDRIFRRACMRVLVRMTFWSAERERACGATHPFMTLLKTNRSELRPLEQFRRRQLEHPLNQGCMLQVVHLMIFVYRRCPWPRRQYLADVEHAKALEAAAYYNLSGPADLARRTMRIALLVPGFLQALLVDNNLWHVVATYRFDRHDAHGCIHDVNGSGRKRSFVLDDFLGSGQEERKLVEVLRNNRLISSWLCGDGGRCLLLELCRMRRRRLVQVSELSNDRVLIIARRAQESRHDVAYHNNRTKPIVFRPSTEKNGSPVGGT